MSEKEEGRGGGREEAGTEEGQREGMDRGREESRWVGGEKERMGVGVSGVSAEGCYSL